MSGSLLEVFADLSGATKDIIADIKSPLLLSLIALKLAKELYNVQALTAEHIVACLEAAGVAVKKRSIQKSLAKANGRVSITKDPVTGESSYKLMTKGKQEVDRVFNVEPLSVVRIEAGKPRTAREALRDILASLKGVVRICDPYYGTKTLNSLDYLDKNCEVRFLTDKTSDKQSKIDDALKDYKIERPKTEFRKIKPPSPVHDRYIVSDKLLIILGHGLKDIGGKESFLIVLESALVPDLIDEMTKVFENMWKDGTPL